MAKKAEKCQTFQRVCTALGCILQRKIVKNQTDANFSSTPAMYEVTVCEAFAPFHPPPFVPAGWPSGGHIEARNGKEKSDYLCWLWTEKYGSFAPWISTSPAPLLLWVKIESGWFGWMRVQEHKTNAVAKRKNKKTPNNTRGMWRKKELSIFHRGMNYFSRVTNHFCQCQCGRFLFRTITGVHTCHWVGSYYILTHDVHPFPACTVVCFTVRKGEVSLVCVCVLCLIVHSRGGHTLCSDKWIFDWKYLLNSFCLN